MKVLLRSSLAHGTDRGEDTFELAAALMKLGADVYLVPTEVDIPVPSLLAATLAKPLPSHFDLALHYVDPVDSEIPRRWRNAGNMNVLWTKHNQTMFNKRLVPDLAHYDAILTADDNTYAAMCDLTTVPMGVLAPGFNSDPWTPWSRDWDGPFTFGMVLTGNKGECPEVAIEAFHKLQKDFDEFAHVNLVIKTVLGDDLNPQLMEHVPGLFIYKANWSEHELRTFYRYTNVMLSPDRGGLRNKAILQFMSTGGTAIATEWSLNTSWLSRAYAFPLEFSWTIVSHKDSRNKFANPDGYKLQELMLEAVQERHRTRQKGQTASDVIPTMLDWSKVLETLFERLDEIAPPEGTTLYDTYKRCVPLQEEKPAWMKS